MKTQRALIADAQAVATGHTDHQIHTLAQLEALFGPIAEASIRKEISRLDSVYRAWIEASPFAVLASSGPQGLDVSPRGDPAPLVRVVDEHTLLLPERKGNNRIDGLRNLVTDPRVSLLFFVPGINETVRVNGSARILIEPSLLASFAVRGNLPKCVLEIKVQTVFFQCARALMRSNLWQAVETLPDVPTAGEILAALTLGEVGGGGYDKALPERLKSTLY